MKIREEDFFVADVMNVEIAYIGEDNNEEIITDFAGIKINATMGKNLVQVYISAVDMEFLCKMWKVKDGDNKELLINDFITR